MEFDTRDIYTFCDSDEGGTLYCNYNSYQTVFIMDIICYTVGNGEWFQQHSKPRMVKFGAKITTFYKMAGLKAEKKERQVVEYYFDLNLTTQMDLVWNLL